MKKIKNIILLAGGDSDRFWPLKDKNLFTFLGKSLIAYIVDNVVKIAENIYIVTNQSNKEKINRVINKEVKVNYITQKDNLPGMAGAIMSCSGKITGEVLILNASDIFDFNILYRLIDQSKQEKYDFAFVAIEVRRYFPGGYLEFKNNKLVGIIEKPSPKKLPSNLMKLVIDYFKDFDQFISLIKKTKGNSDSRYEEASSLYIRNYNCGYIVYKNFWYVLKYSWHVLSMMKLFLSTLKKNNISKSASISKNAMIISPVFLGENVKVGDYSKIVGPCFIDDDTVIGDYVMMRESHIGKKCLVGGYCEVTRSYLSTGVMLHRNYVGDSVLFDNVLMGSGAVTANYRFDARSIKSLIKGVKIDTDNIKFGTVAGENAKIGVNATILPGVKIGKNAVVWPGEIAKADIYEK